MGATCTLDVLQIGDFEITSTLTPGFGAHNYAVASGHECIEANVAVCTDSLDASTLVIFCHQVSSFCIISEGDSQKHFQLYI
jgi:hypothetical protein